MKTVTRDKDAPYMTKGINQEDITIINTYAPDIGAPQYVRQILTTIKRNRQYHNNSEGF